MNATRVRIAVALITAGLTVAAPTAAFADGERLLVNAGAGWVTDSTGPVFATSDFVPGATKSAVVSVWNDTSHDTRLTLSSANIHDDDNGCSRPEALVDTTCGSGGGELGHRATFSVYVDADRDGTYLATPVWSGTVYGLTSAQVLTPVMPAHAIWNYRVDLSLPLATGNEAQSDQLEFDLLITSDGLTASLIVSKTAKGSGNVVTKVLSSLPGPGGPVARGLVGTLDVLVFAGVYLLALRPRRWMRHPNRPAHGTSPVRR